MGGTSIELIRESFGRKVWGDIYVQLSAADHDTLAPQDLDWLATAAYGSEEALGHAERGSLAQERFSAASNP